MRWKKPQFFSCQSEALRVTFGICRRDGVKYSSSTFVERVPVDERCIILVYCFCLSSLRRKGSRLRDGRQTSVACKNGKPTLAPCLALPVHSPLRTQSKTYACKWVDIYPTRNFATHFAGTRKDDRVRLMVYAR